MKIQQINEDLKNNKHSQSDHKIFFYDILQRIQKSLEEILEGNDLTQGSNRNLEEEVSHLIYKIEEIEFQDVKINYETEKKIDAINRLLNQLIQQE